MKVKDYLGKVNVKDLRERLEEFFNDASGFVFIYTGKDNRLTDAYKDICARCVLKGVKTVLADADRIGLLAEKRKGKNDSGD